MNHPDGQLPPDDSDFEDALRSLTPTAPSHNPFPTEHAPGIVPFPEPERRPLLRPFLAAAAVVAATLLSLPLLLPEKPDPVAATGPTSTAEITFDIEPVQTVGYLVDARPAPIIDVPGGTPLRPVRVRSVNTTLYRDHASGSTITVGEPRDQVLLVPVSFH